MHVTRSSDAMLPNSDATRFHILHSSAAQLFPPNCEASLSDTSGVAVLCVKKVLLPFTLSMHALLSVVFGN